jgi:hypothetical protein
MDESAAYPGWELLKQELAAAIDSGEGTALSSVQAMTVLGEMQRREEEMQRLDARLNWALRLLRQVKDGNSCWHFSQGFEQCVPPGVELFLQGAPRRRWWQSWRRQETS